MNVRGWSASFSARIGGGRRRVQMDASRLREAKEAVGALSR